MIKRETRLETGGRRFDGHHRRVEWLDALTEKDLESRYYWNQSRGAVPEMPNQEKS